MKSIIAISSLSLSFSSILDPCLSFLECQERFVAHVETGADLLYSLNDISQP